MHLRDRGLPIVLANGFMPGVDAPFVSNDDEASIELALNHLIHLGHHRIGLAVGPQRYVPSQRKIAGFHRFLKDFLGDFLGEDAVGDLVETEMYTVEGGQAAAQRLVEKGCTAIVCGSDLMALGAIRGVRAVGMRVPDDISVIGYDDSTLIAFTDPPLTTIRHGVLAMGECAVQALVDEIAGMPVSRTEYVFRPELVVRGSGWMRQGSAVACSRSSRSCSRVSTTSATDPTRYAACVAPLPTLTGTSPCCASRVLNASSSVTSSPV